MLAEKKSRVKWTLNPRGNLWSQDSNKFGQKMLEKMGWKAGKGLGANEQGITEHIKVSYKSDNKCIGYKDHGDEWIQQQSQFEDFLSELSASHNKETSLEDEKGNNSLEQRSRQSKARVHYQKFTRGKDLSKYSKHDLACILGVKKPKAEINGRINDSQEEPRVGRVDDSFGVTTIHSGSMSDYFNKKNKFNCQTEASDVPSSSDIEVERLDKQKKKKQRNLDVTYAECELDQDHQISEELNNEPVDVVKKKNKKDKLNASCYLDGDKLANETSEFYDDDDENLCNSELTKPNNEEEKFNLKKRKYVSEEGRFENSENRSNSETMMVKKKRKKKKYCNNEEDINNTDKSVSKNSLKEVSETENDNSREKKKHKDSNPEESKDSQEGVASKQELENVTNEDFKGQLVDSAKKKKKKSNNIKEFVEGDSKENENEIVSSNGLVEVSEVTNEDFKGQLVDSVKKKKKKCNNIKEGDSKENENEIVSSNDLIEVSEEVLVETARRKKKKKSGNNINEYVEGVCRQDETVISNDITAVSEEEKASNFTVQKKTLKKNSSSSVFSAKGHEESDNAKASGDSEEQCLETFANEHSKEVTVESKKRKKKKSHINNEIIEQISTKQDESIVHNDVIDTTKLENETVEVFTEKKKRKKKSNNFNMISIEHELHEKDNIDDCKNALVETEQEEKISFTTSIENKKKNKKKKEKLTDKDMEEIEVGNENRKREGSPLRHVNSNEESVKSNENDQSNLITKKKKRKSCDISEDKNLEYNKNLDCKTDMETQKKKKKKKSHDNNEGLIVSPDESSSVNVMDVVVPGIELQAEKKKRKKKVDSCEVIKTKEVISQESDDNDDVLNKSSKEIVTRTKTDDCSLEKVSAVATSSVNIKNMKPSMFGKLIKSSDIEFNGSNLHEIKGYGS